MPLAAFILGLCSLVVATLALGWNIGTWLMSTARARCILLHGVSNGSAIVSGPVGKDGQPRSADIAASLAQGFGNGGEILGIEVHNVGRAPLVVTRYEAVMEPKCLSLAPVADAFGPTLPHSIAPGDSAQWWVRMDEVRATAHAATGTVVERVTGAHMKVTTALRKETRTKTSIQVS